MNEAKRDWDKFFQPEDFDTDHVMNKRISLYSDKHFSKLIAFEANAILSKELEKAKKVFGLTVERDFPDFWSREKLPPHTHTALLIGEREINK